MDTSSTKFTKKKYVAYFLEKLSSSEGIAGQKAIVTHFATQDGCIVAEYVEEKHSSSLLQQAIRFCKKHSYTLIVATLDMLSDSADTIISIKKKLGHFLKSCDVPKGDLLSITTALQIFERKKLLNSLRVKGIYKAKKQKGHIYGNTRNLTLKGRLLGMETIRKNRLNDPIAQKIIPIITKCKARDMSFGEIAQQLNKNGFRTQRGKLFYRTTVKRLYEKAES